LSNEVRLRFCAPADPTVSNASNVRGYNLHAQTRVSAHDEAARLRLFRYILRPAIAQDRLHFDNGLVTFTMKRVFSDGSQVLRFTPQAFIRRIAMLVPAPRQHEITYFGLLAANQTLEHGGPLARRRRDEQALERQLGASFLLRSCRTLFRPSANYLELRPIAYRRQNANHHVRRNSGGAAVCDGGHPRARSTGALRDLCVRERATFDYVRKRGTQIGTRFNLRSVSRGESKCISKLLCCLRDGITGDVRYRRVS
jgi:hypothetical protein